MVFSDDGQKFLFISQKIASEKMPINFFRILANFLKKKFILDANQLYKFECPAANFYLTEKLQISMESQQTGGLNDALLLFGPNKQCSSCYSSCYLENSDFGLYPLIESGPQDRLGLSLSQASVLSHP